MSNKQRSGPSAQGLLLIVFLSFTVLAAVGRQTAYARDAGEDPLPRLLNLAAWVAGGITLLLLGAFLWRLSALRKRNALAAGRPDALVVSVLRSVQVRDALKSILGTNEKQSVVPAALNLLADSVGIAVLDGSQTLVSFGWGDVRAIEPTIVQELGRTSRGLAIVIERDDLQLELPFIVTGRGLGGLFPEHQDVLEDLSRAIEGRRPAN